MEHILVLGGGVGGTLTANLLVRRLRRRIDAGDVDVTVVDATGRHVYQPGFMAIAMGGERAERLSRPERSLLDRRVRLVVLTVAGAAATAKLPLAAASRAAPDRDGSNAGNDTGDGAESVSMPRARVSASCIAPALA